MPPRIAVTSEQVDLVVARFYARLRDDPQLGPVFATHVQNWPLHEEKIARFWRNALLYEREYDGNPMLVHREAGNVQAAHFSIWLDIFDVVLTDTLPPDLAAQWSALAHRIGRGLRLGLQPALTPDGVPQLRS
ncbi:hemoglobin [Sulfitobacter undariae]|uniref:Hemoglobin n=1 Tax=Sulfitobacter undariae TaxID=1563671 RepID=A0A7W6E590_9RHOB|nr:group III truncated hemoglobin [Sulfitobacter undariae]MBB3993716.1 hemoglobin [Sulfitobacter undariae]